MVIFHLLQNILQTDLCLTGRTPELLPAALRAVEICRYLVYSEADFEVFCVAPMG